MDIAGVGTGTRPPICAIADVVWQPARATSFVAPPDLHHGASLSEWLAKGKAFIDALLPASRLATGMINRFLARRPTVSPCATTCVAKLHSRVALAVDRGVLHLSGQDLATPAIRFLEQLAHRRCRDAHSLARILREYKPPRRGHFKRRDYLGWLYVLGAIDTARRGFRPPSDAITLRFPKRATAASAAAWLAAAIPEDVAVETAELLRSLRACRPRGRFVPNPVLGGTWAFGGSDGDWIAGDTLVELKCVTSFKRDYAAQLLCYYFVDQTRPPSERFNFGRLALCLPRQCATLVGTPDDWLAAFGGAPDEIAVDGVLRYWGERQHARSSQ